MITAIWAIVIFCTLIFIHEFGHFITAKLSGMTVHEFSIGMGPKIFSFGKKTTRYSLRILPIGGFVKLEGEDGESNDQNAFCNKSAFKRFCVLFAGAFMNILLGFIIFFVFFLSTTRVASNEISVVSNGSVFEENGIKPGDKIVEMNGKNYSSGIHSYRDISFFLYINGNDSAEITFERNGEEFTKNITPKPIGDGDPKFGMEARIVNPGILDCISLAFWECIFVIKSVFLSLWWLITGFIPASEMGGPVAIVGQIGAAARQGWQSVLSFAGLISVNLGVMNLLPIPALDGGRIMFLGIEKIRRKKMKPETEGMINFVFFVILMLLMVLVTFSDIRKLI